MEGMAVGGANHNWNVRQSRSYSSQRSGLRGVRMYNMITISPHQNVQLAQRVQVLHWMRIANQLMNTFERDIAGNLVLPAAFRTGGGPARQCDVIARTIEVGNGKQRVILSSADDQARDHM